MADSLYVHIPFCRHICHYCDFAKRIYNEELADQYLDQLEKEISRIRQDRFDTVYIGGGTPSALNCRQLEKLFGMLSVFTVGKEFTFEINPETMTLEKAMLLRKHGVNRVSIGLQTFNETILKEIGRTHVLLDAENTFRYLKEAGIDNISVDLMYGFENQTVEQLQQDIEKAVSLDIKHISIYELEVHEGTVLGHRGYRNCSDDDLYLMYSTIRKQLPLYGFQQYEISNFALEGYQSVHNKTYWHYYDYIGVGLGAAGKENHIRYENTHSLKEYLAGNWRQEEIKLSREDERFESVMMGLRLLEGINIKEYNKTLGCNILDHYRKPIENNLLNGRLIVDGGYLKLSDTGIYLMNDVLVDFMVWL
ncbi:MAG: radical SAM family heme chaperone HemW [Erysipelotrichaceae bacterium]|nr:radical SAM family heme chaperone HemW [Erysipelotrichaceae bacterium]